MNKLRHIFSDKNLNKLYPILENSLEHEHVDFIKHNIESFKSCKTFDCGFFQFTCPKCSHSMKLPFSCNSRFCPQCGKKYANQWAESISKQLLNVPHRIGFFTIPKALRCYFYKNRHNLIDLVNIIQHIFSHLFSQRKVKYFGLILTIHTFGRDIDFNPHIHFIVTEGGFTSDFKWKKVDYFHYDLIKKAWKVLIFDILKLFYGHTNKFWKLKRQCYQNQSKDNGFFVAMKDKLNNSLDALKYLARYLARPAITDYRIISFDDNNVKFWYEHVQTKERIELTLPIIDFMGRLVSHIPPKNFKMVRRFGIYARRKCEDLKTSILLKKIKRLFSVKRASFREYILKIMGVDILECPACNTVMELKLINWKGKIYAFKT